MPPLLAVPGGVRLTLHVLPRARVTELAGLHGDAVKLRVAAPPADGAANAEIIRFLAERVGFPRSQVRTVSGETSRRKVIEVRGVDATTLVRVLGLE